MTIQRGDGITCCSCRQENKSGTCFGEMPEIWIEDHYCIAEDIWICDDCLNEAERVRLADRSEIVR